MSSSSNHLRRVVALTALLCAGACSSTNDPAAIPIGTIRGTVTDAESRAPLSGVAVSYGIAGAVSADDGTYEVAGVPQGGSAVTASKPGYSTYHGWYVFNPLNVVVRNLSLTPIPATP